MTDDPFAVLRLAPDATEEAAVAQAARLARLAPDEASRNRIRQAIQRLTESPEAWQLLAELSHPRPEYANAEIERFVAANRRPPPATGDAAIPGVDWDEVRSLCLDVMAEALRPTPLPLSRGEVAESAAEIDRQSAEATWQGLMAQPGG